jgi:hypothetical protein
MYETSSLKNKGIIVHIIKLGFCKHSYRRKKAKLLLLSGKLCVRMGLWG